MNRDEAIQRAEVAMAWAQGEMVQYRTNPLNSRWNDMSHDPHAEPAFFRDGIEWRIKPKPLECWAKVSNDGEPFCYTAWSDEKPEPDVYGRWVRMREVE